MAALHSRSRADRCGGVALMTALTFALILALPTIALGIAPPAISGTVTNADTAVEIEGASVTSYYDDGVFGYYDYAQTDSGGWYQLNVGGAAGDYEVWADAGNGYVASNTEYITYDGANPVTQDFALQPIPLAFEGVVTNADNGDPLGSVYVEATFDDVANSEYYSDYAYSDSDDGSYKLYLDGPAATYSVWAWVSQFYGLTEDVYFDGTSTTTRNFALQPHPAAFAGVVTDADTGNALWSARVEAQYSDGGALSFYDATYTEEDGSYKLYPGVHVATFTYAMKAEQETYETVTDDVDFDGTNTTAKDFALTRYPVAFSGTVTDADTHQSIGGAQVSAYYFDSDAGVAYEDYDGTDDDGTYQLRPGRAATYAVSASESGYFGQAADVAFDGSTTATKDFELQMFPIAFQGTVTDADTDLALEDAYVEASFYDSGEDINYDDYAYTNSAGEYSMRPGGPAATYTLSARQARYGSASADVAYNGSTATTKNFELELNGIAFEGTVTDADTGLALEDAEVRASFYDADAGVNYSDYYYTDPAGAYSLRPGPAATYAVTAEKQRYISSELDVAYGGVAPTTQDFALQQQPLLFEGIVTNADTGLPLADADITAQFFDVATGNDYWDETTTDASGTYKLRPGGPEGTYAVNASKRRYVDASADVWTNGSDPTTQDFALEPKALAFEGTVRDLETDAELEGAPVSAWYYNVATDTYYEDYTWSRADGTYELRPGGPAATYGVEAYKDRYYASSLELAYDGTTAVTHDFDLEPKALAFKGTVTNAVTHSAIQTASVSAYFYDTESATEFEDWAQTDVTGSYELYPGPAATYSMMAAKSEYAAIDEDVVFDGTNATTKNFALNPLAGDAYELDNTAAAAKAITPNAALQSRTLFPAGDKDWVTLAVQAGVHYVFYTGSPGDDTDTYVYLYEADGTTFIAKDDDSGPGVSSRLRWTPNADQQVRLKVQGYDPEVIGVYELGVATDSAPVAVDDTYSVVQGGALEVGAPGMLVNDTDADGDELQCNVSGDVSHGTLQYADEGSFGYTPGAAFSGTDTFSYEAVDAWGYTDTAVVTINVLPIEDTPVNDAPVAASDFAAVAEDGTLTVPAAGVLTNDIDPDGDDLTAEKVTNPVHGALIFNADGSYGYKPVANYHGPDSFTYKAKDPDGLCSEIVTVSLSVTSVNDAPVGVADTGATSEDVTLYKGTVDGVLGNDTDVDGDTLTAEKVAGPAHGTLVLNANGSYAYTPAANYSGADSFTYKAKDAGGLRCGAAVTVSIMVAEATDPTLLALTSTDKTLSAYGASYTLTGKLTAVEGGAGLGGRSLVIQSSKTRTGVFTDTLSVAVTAADGSFSIALKPAATTYYKARFSGDAAAAGPYNASECASAVRVTPRASVGAPVAPTTMYTTKSAKVYGSLKPRHTAGTYPVRIYKWRYVGGKWKAMGYVKAKASNYSTYSRYSAAVKLPYKGKWKLKAYHVADAGHPAQWSAKVDYVTVR